MSTKLISPLRNNGQDGLLLAEEASDYEPAAVNFEMILSTVVRNRFIILGIVLACVLVALSITALTRPKYTAFASVQIDQQTARVLGSEDTDTPSAYVDADRFLQTQVDILESRTLAERVATALSLDQSNAFIIQMGDKVPPAIPGTDQRSTIHNMVVSELMKNLKISLPRDSRVATIKFISPTPKVAADVSNAFANQFILANLRRRFDATSYARNFLQGRLEDVRRRLENSERAVNAYARSSGLIDASNAASASSNNADLAAGPRSLIVSRLVELNGALVRAQIARTEAQERWNQARKTPVLSLPDVLTNGAIQALQQQRAQLSAAYVEEMQHRRETYPTMIQEASRLKELDEQINKMAQDVRRSISDNYQAALAQERETKSAISRAERSTRDEQDRSVGFNILRREVDTNRELYAGLLQRFKELSAEAGVATNNISIVDLAEVPRSPTSPRTLLNIVAGLVLGLVAAGAVVIFREMFDDRVRLPEDVPAKLGLPLLGSIPAITGSASPSDLLDDPKSEFAEAYQSLRATLELSTLSGVPRSLLITSTRPSEGKSTSAIAVARAFAGQGRRVVLVDGDLRRPSLHKLVGLENKLGMSNILTGQSTLNDVVQKTAVDNLQFIASGPIPPNPAQLLEANAVRALYAALLERFDLMIIDAPPVLGLADALELAAGAQGVLFLVESGSMHFGGVRSSLNRLKGVRANLIGVILNKFDARAAGYSSGYSYSYTYKYSRGS